MPGVVSASPHPTTQRIAAAFAELRESLEMPMAFPADGLADARGVDR